MLQVLNYDVYGLERAVMASGLPMATDTDKVGYSDKRAKVLGAAKPGSGHDCFLKGIVVEARVKYPLYWTKQFQRYHFADIVSSQSTMHRVTKFNIDEQCNEWVDKGIISIIQGKIDCYNYMEENRINNCFQVFGFTTDRFEFTKTKEEALKIGIEGWMKHHTDVYGDLDSWILKTFIKERSKNDVFMEIISCLPSGFEMEMEIVTNYLQLKTILEQRQYHKLPDWRVFCDWIESLPNFKEFTTKEEK